MSLTARPKAPTHYKKRQAGHHRQSKSYVKTYWPYLPMAAIIAGGVFVNTLLSSSEAVLGWQANFSSSSLLALTNSDRSSDHEATLSLNTQLSSAAQARANDMVKNNYWSHTSPSGQTAENFIINSGYQFAAAGENLAYGFASTNSVNTAWMNSADHKANILNSSYTNVGFGVAESPNYLGQGTKVIVVAEYAQPSDSTALGVVNQPPMQTVSRLDKLTGSNASWSEIALTTLITASVVIIAFKHWLGMRKFVMESEEYIIKHPMLDIAIVFVATLATVLSHSAGLIG
jgi:uncharacterized protein YkwD